MPKLFTLLFFVFQIGIISAQTKIQSTILGQESQAPLEGVLIYLYAHNAPVKVSGPDGRFSYDLETLGISYYGEYKMSFFKPGYKTLSKSFRFPLLDNIYLEQKSNGFIQVRNQRGDFLENLEINTQHGNNVRTNNFGYAEIDIPPGMSSTKQYRIAVKGGELYEDYIKDLSVEELRDHVIEINLKERILSYEDYKRKLLHELDGYENALRTDDKIKQFRHLDNSHYIINQIGDLIDLSPEEQKERSIILPVHHRYINELEDLAAQAAKVRRIELLHTKAARDYQLAYDEYIKNPPPRTKAPSQLDHIIGLALECVEHACNRFKDFPYATDLVENDVKTVFTLLDFLENHLSPNLAKEGLKEESKACLEIRERRADELQKTLYDLNEYLSRKK